MRYALICMLILSVMTTDVRAEQRVVFDPPPTTATGESLVTVAVHHGAGGACSQPYRAERITGVMNPVRGGETYVHVFFTASEDSSALQAMLSAAGTMGDKVDCGLRGDDFTEVFRHGSYLRVPLTTEGRFFFVVDAYRYGKKSAMLFVDRDGVVVGQRALSWR